MSPLAPHVQKHLDAGDRNRRLAEYAFRHGADWCDPPPHEWVLTMAFYATLQYVDAYLVARAGGSPADHVARNRLVGTVTALQQVEIAYTHLYSLSRLARYEPMRAFSRATVQTALNEMRYVLAEVRRIL